ARLAGDSEVAVEGTVAGREPPDVGGVASPTVRIVGGVRALRDRRASRVLEIIDAAATHVRVLDAAEIHPDLRVLMPEHRCESNVRLIVVRAPLVAARPRLPRGAVDGVRGRAEREDVDDH